MLTNLEKMLRLAQMGRFSVGSFNVYNYETIKGVLAGAERKRVPVIVAFGAGYLPNMDLEEVVALVSYRAEKMDLPVALHLDHCRNPEIIKKAAICGFTSVMYDGSSLPFDENLKNTAEIVAFAHTLNVSVEAELGSLALGAYSNEGEVGSAEQYTDPRSAHDFCERTGIDALAVSIGTVHGMYKGEPNIRVDILKKIRRETAVPLVLHGGSGTPEAILRECIANGICKINVNTEISKHAVDRIARAVEKDPDIHLSKVSLKTIEAVEEVVEKYIALFSR
ncbi:MAG: class II fructose-bisphosphate aldolase [Treponemataceae bacterium]